jgi:hypothetical protein
MHDSGLHHMNRENIRGNSRFNETRKDQAKRNVTRDGTFKKRIGRKVPLKILRQKPTRSNSRALRRTLRVKKLKMMLVAYEDRGFHIDEISTGDIGAFLHRVVSLDEAKRILAEAAKRRPDVQWLIVGTGPWGVRGEG